ncbi:amino acid aminotransferase, putative [Syntrophotalea carbinolica DSM 2380]|uniref:Amino acid aminotransferase, putative n=1 Tax=Syntrophotalea carbinolica (strain DSM 2380 / NBRC 103641 / GraBd1) TaxID=338963 RepID=Q3A417_SYNC1|nr:aminotransferase class I/II-fold pyridoxal phosphate-dependent enzyme [Syntrophotalea carbinolica]ABA88890.1 amino acid aminotransferase, putative [Syntrophotalea carbinolica DSM 2380]
MNPLAIALNKQLEAENPAALDLLSRLGKNLFFPKGILTQSAEAKTKAHKFNATIGIATENGEPMYLPCIHKKLDAFKPSDLYGYAPPAGKPELRQLWRDKMLRDNPSLGGKSFGTPVVTNALTHGLSIVADLFVEQGDQVIMADMMWGNYNLTFGVRRGGEICKYATFTEDGAYNIEAFRKVLHDAATKHGKAVVVLNFPNNPSGYTPSVAEGEAIVEVLRQEAENGCNIVAVTDDAYFGLFYKDCLKESLFGRLVDLHPRLLAVKIDGSTKEDFVWGFRTGFITFGGCGASDNSDLLKVLETKTLGIIRGTISNCPHPSQSFIIEGMKSPEYAEQKRQKFKIMQGRALKTLEILENGAYDDAWDFYPFNSGYFMCLKLKTVDAEQLRLHLLDQYGIGTIAINSTDLRIAFSCIEEEDLPELFDLIYQAVKDLC